MNSSDSKVKSKLVLAKNLNFNDKKLELVELFAQEVLNYNQKYKNYRVNKRFYKFFIFFHFYKIKKTKSP